MYTWQRMTPLLKVFVKEDGGEFLNEHRTRGPGQKLHHHRRQSGAATGKFFGRRTSGGSLTSPPYSPLFRRLVAFSRARRSNERKEKTRRKRGKTAAEGMGKKVVAHVYDVTNSGSDKANNTVLHINRFFKDTIGLGGIFHSAIQVYGDEEWSFGFCEQGSGVFCCTPCKNAMYTYRESIDLGETDLSAFMVERILRELSLEWPGSSYDLLSRNCNHFCDVFCQMLEVPKLPAWVNRFANAGDAALEVAANTASSLKRVKEEITDASKLAYNFLSGADLIAPAAADDESVTGRIADGAMGTWFRNLFGDIGAKPSSSNSSDNLDDEESNAVAN